MKAIRQGLGSDNVACEVIQQRLSLVTDRGFVPVANGSRKTITGAVTVREGLALARMILALKAETTIETGVGCGISTLAICSALDALGRTGEHIGIDPNQFDHHNGCAIQLLREFALERRFRLRESPTHMACADLISAGTQVDFAFIDGWHTFDYILVDFFFLDKLLRVGGVLAIHDTVMPATKKVLEFIRTHRRYTLLEYEKVDLLRSGYRLLKCVRYRDPYFMYPLRRRPNLLFLKKTDDWEPVWNYWSNF